MKIKPVTFSTLSIVPLNESKAVFASIGSLGTRKTWVSIAPDDFCAILNIDEILCDCGDNRLRVEISQHINAMAAEIDQER